MTRLIALYICTALKPSAGRYPSFLRKHVKTLLRLIQFKFLRLFTSITLETTAYCNRECEFCPNHPKYPKRGKGLMSEAAYRKAVSELGNINYVGRISPHLYGEPLLDKRLNELIRFTREACPYANIMVMSNGDMLTEAVLKELIASGMDEIYVTCYDEAIPERLSTLAKQYRSYVTIRLFRNVEKRNRAGIIDNVPKALDSMSPCPRPASQIVVNWHGDIVLCCNDYYGKYLFGNVEEKGLVDIWQSQEYSKFKNVLLRPGGRQDVDLCKQCNG
ncbi:MAG: SPASM domain-containing protein [Pseudomonadota bacterium]